MKKLIILMLILFSTTLIFGEYLALKSGKILKVKGKVRYDAENAYFTMSGSDVEIKISLSKIDLNRTKKINSGKYKKKTVKKEVKTYTKDDLASSKAKISFVGSRAVATDDENDEGGLNEDLFNIPTYYADEISENENEWWQAEVSKVQNMLREAMDYNRKRVEEYNNFVMENNSKPDKVREQARPELERLMQLVKDSKDLMKMWHNAMTSLHAAGVELQKEERLMAPLANTIEATKEIIK